MNKLFKILLVATSIAPILLTYWFSEQVSKWNKSVSFVENLKSNYHVGIEFLFSTILLVCIFYLILYLSKSRLETIPIDIEEIKTADNESISFILVYLLPLANGVIDSFNIPILVFIAILFFFIVMTSNSYHFNPLINLLGYHFYEAKINGGINYILISTKNINSGKSIKEVHLLTEYMILEK